MKYTTAPITVSTIFLSMMFEIFFALTDPTSSRANPSFIDKIIMEAVISLIPKMNRAFTYHI